MGVRWDNSGWKGPWGAQPTARVHRGCLWGQGRLLRAWLWWILKASEAGEGPASLGAPRGFLGCSPRPPPQLILEGTWPV